MKTSIIITCSNNFKYLQRCIQNIELYTNSLNYEVIIIDHVSTDGTREWLQSQDKYHYLLNDVELNYPRAYNEAIKLATGEHFVFLSIYAVVTANWLENLLTCLQHSNDVGAVMPVTNHLTYFNSVNTTYSSLEEMQNFAKQFNVSNMTLWHQRIRMTYPCFAIKKSVVDKVGLFDEYFSPGYYEEADYSYRIEQMGYRILLCKDTFIHSEKNYYSFNPSKVDESRLKIKNSKKFEAKWHFQTDYSSSIRTEILDLMNASKDQQLNVLEVGCATGATLLEIKNNYPNANVYGVEINKHSASIGQNFINITAEDIENKINYPENFFDYIICGDVIEHLYDPWKVLDNLRTYLKEDGFILISIPNVMHYSLIFHVINGHWTYQDYGLLDRTHIRFFTLTELNKMMTNAFYTNINYSPIIRYVENAQYEAFLDYMTSQTDSQMRTQYLTFQYLVKAQKSPNDYVKRRKDLELAINEIDLEKNTDNHFQSLLQTIQEETITLDSLLTIIEEKSYDPATLLTTLALKGFDQQLDPQAILKILKKAYLLNSHSSDILYNLAYVLAAYDQVQQAIDLLLPRLNQDTELETLYQHLLAL